MNKHIETKDLFNCTIDYLTPLFSHKYPWEILPKISEFVRNFESFNHPDYKKLENNIFVGKNVKISPLATIEANTIIGNDCEIRPGAYLRGNVIIGNNCVIGNSCELKNCILLNNVQVPHYNYVGDSILGNHSHLGAGSICSNLKADKKNVVIHAETEYQTNLRKVGAFIADNADVGCNCVLNPGTIIGKNTNIYPLTSVRGTIPPNSILKSPNNIITKLK